MNEQRQPAEIIDEIATAVAAHVTDLYDAEDIQLIMQGMWLAMQRVGGPREAAVVIGYCTPKLS